MKLDLSSIDILKLTPKTRRLLLKAVEAVADELNGDVSPTNAPPPPCGPGEENCKG